MNSFLSYSKKRNNPKYEKGNLSNDKLPFFIQHILKSAVIVVMNDNNLIILFDGICNLCNSTVNFILKKDKKKQFRFVALQSEEGKNLIEKYKIPQETDSVILIRKNVIFIESDSAIEISQHLPIPWNWAVVFKIIPKNWRDKIYRWIAKNRYRWFGKRNSCRIV